MRRSVWLWVGLVVGFCSMGASCSPRVGNPFGFGGPQAPAVLTPTATAADVVAAINANASRVQTYQAPNATIATPDSAGLPLVNANIAIERPLRFRLRATTAITGPEIDLGSNEERFWIWARRNEPPALYTARHDQWASSPVRGQAPIEPAWLIDALGLVRLDPATIYAGPTPKGDGLVELGMRVDTPQGPSQRVLVVDATTAEVREQHVYDASGALAASVTADNYRYDPTSGASLPERVRVSVPMAGLELTINTGPVTINAPLGDPAGLWTPPQLPGTPIVDLAGGAAAPVAAGNAWDLEGRSAAAAAAPIAAPFGPPVEAAASQAPAGFWDLPPSAARPAAAPLAGRSPAGQSPADPPVTAGPRVRPLPPPAASNGFVGLPASGRSF
ncbi:MAG: hypothetical protein RIC11_18990 [Botrimarina sp.]